jgi:multidrug efflux pump
MKLSTISIKRPVFASVMSFAILLFGIIAFTRLPVREYPDIDPPIISVITLYRGASPSVVETEITNVLEEQFATLEGVKTMTSSSREQGSVITIEFELNRKVDEAANDVRDRVSRVRGNLPREIDDPVISKVDANAQPIVWLALSSDNHNGLELTDVADRILKERIQRLAGVGSVIIGGERKYAMRVWLDPLHMAAHGLTTQDIEAAIRRENAAGVSREWKGSSPSGRGAILPLLRNSGRSSCRRIKTTSSGCATSLKSMSVLKMSVHSRGIMASRPSAWAS